MNFFIDILRILFLISLFYTLPFKKMKRTTISIFVYVHILPALKLKKVSVFSDKDKMTIEHIINIMYRRYL